MRRIRSTVWLFAAISVLVSNSAHAGDFYLKKGDRVVFYGDSITDQRLYTTFTETFVVTRFPKLDVKFVHSGWGGDRVGGGGGGPIDLRLKRDVIAYKPTVMTIMLGMNDASYRAYDEKIFNTYAKGYERIIKTVKEAVPGVRITVIQPSPFDDVTRKPNFEGGYNAVLVRYGEFLADLAKKQDLTVADLNTSVVDATKKAFETDPKDATKLNPDRVHPGLGGQLLMSAALLKAWDAPALVSDVAIEVDDDHAHEKAKNAKVSEVKVAKDEVSWEQLDDALPFPIDRKDPIVALAVKSSDILKSLDQEMLKVTGLPAGSYELKIDDKSVGKFDEAKLAGGINLAALDTPMSAQAAEVHALTIRRANLHNFRWRQVHVPFQREDQAGMAKVLEGFDEMVEGVRKKQYAAAQPKSHHFQLTRQTSP